MDRYINEDHVMQNILERISNDYHLYKRKEIFETLNGLFAEEKYQSFITLGLIQIEGLFDDYCAIRYGESENQGTLIEKAQKTLETNEYSFLSMYPYFAFDIPLLRNEVAHKGILQTENAKRMAYSLVLDLNTLSQMVKSESMDKFIYTHMIFDKLNAYEPTDDANTDGFFDTLLHELLMFDKMANDHFGKILKNPEDYREELEFYRKPDLPDDRIDLPGIVQEISDLVKSDGFWRALHRLVNECIRFESKWLDVYDFAKRMKNQYISILEGEACKKQVKTYIFRQLISGTFRQSKTSTFITAYISRGLLPGFCICVLVEW